MLLSSSLDTPTLDILFTTAADLGWLHGTAPLTGVLLLVVLGLMTLLSLPCVRKSGYFEVMSGVLVISYVLLGVF